MEAYLKMSMERAKEEAKLFEEYAKDINRK